MPEHAVSVLRSLAILVLLPLVLAGCFGEPETGPVKIRYGRDTCDFCRMIISDPRFAAQIRGGEKHTAYKFDDIGDGIHFLEQQAWKDDPKVEFWVMNSEDAETWLDARKAHYLRGQPTPMDYGYAAIPDAREGTLTFAEMADKVREAGPSSRCLPQSGPAITPLTQPQG
ncbi:nitrous oxide reductase accessory protein NosL [Rhodobium gokarnense]|uniref:Nitrous oxide reductase accessory protein NosL n=1 Tax=Rhodobium gokarnense TaxID=364296 RepID=A0ABT3H839_9HYPH|nr:nitrous oxide reductase accessory protein NosL [Rhodobium gokarnense]MCW2306481.1 nitrous oxide reductase accessory protein NosL [Rhodobium gokarnense]